MTSPLSPLSWPAWHTLPAPPAVPDIRWSYEAWEGAYGEPWAPHWKPWPWETDFLQGLVNAYEPKPPPTGAEIWQNILDVYKKIDENRTLWPQTWPDLRTYTCPGCMRPQYAPGYCGICGPVWIAAQARKPIAITPIITL